MGGIASVAILAAVAGVGALILIVRDRLRDSRGVPEWKRKRGELRAERAGAVVNLLWHGTLCVACVVTGARLSDRALGVSLIVLGVLGALWLIQRYARSNRRITDRIRQTESADTAHTVTLEKKG